MSKLMVHGGAKTCRDRGDVGVSVTFQHERIGTIYANRQGYMVVNMVHGKMQHPTWSDAVMSFAHYKWESYVGRRADAPVQCKYIPKQVNLTTDRWSDR